MDFLRACKTWPILLCALLAWGCAGGAKAPVAAAGPGLAFGAAERAIIARYYADARGGPAPLPVARFKAGDRLESGLRPQHLPTDLAARLPDLPAGYTRLVVGADILLIHRDSHAILDVLPAVAY